MQLAPCLLLIAALSAAFPAGAILIRADRDDAEYLELATRYASSVALNTPDGGEGVLIAPRWILTSAHRAKALQELKSRPRLRLGEDDPEIQAFFIHPEWKGGSANDIALLLLRKGARDVEPTALYRERDENGKAVAIVGHGHSGKIGAGSTSWDRKKRAAINTVDRVEARALGLRIKPLDDASDLQGAVTPSDGGAPAFVEVAAGIFVAGINSETGGEWETYARVSAFVPWIEATMLDVAAKEAAALMDPDRR